MTVEVAGRVVGMRRSVRRKASLAALCVLALAAPVLAGEDAAAPVSPQALAEAESKLAGRWEGPAYQLARPQGCDGTRCQIVLDISPCKAGWCGVEVEEGDRCGATALRLKTGTLDEHTVRLKGDLSLAEGTEPYTVEASLFLPDSEEDKLGIQLLGDTGGEFRMFRRSFPFEAQLARIGDAKCRPESTVSSLIE